MYEIDIYKDNTTWVAIATTTSILDAWNIYRATCNLAEFLGTDCALIDGNTAEVIQCLMDEDF